MSLALQAAHMAKLLSKAHASALKSLAEYSSQDTLGTVTGDALVGMG